MKITTGVASALLALSLPFALGACSSDDAGTAATDTAATGVPKPQANGGLGTWTGTTEGAVALKATVPAAAAPNAVLTAADQCRQKLGKDAEVTWILVDIDATKSADSAYVSSGTLVTDDGKAYDVDNPVTLLNEWYGDAPETADRASCVETNGKLADQQGEVPAGAKDVALYAVKGTVPNVKALSFYVSGPETRLSYTGS